MTYDDQMTLHQFFAPTKNLTDRVAIAHRQSVAKQHPSLPQRAGKIYVQIDFYARAMQKVIAEQPAQPVELEDQGHSETRSARSAFEPLPTQNRSPTADQSP